MNTAAAGILYLDPHGRVLLVQPSYKQHWDIPGGIVELGESPRETAAREVQEELGIVREPPFRLLVVDTVVTPQGMLTAFVFWGGWLDTDKIKVDGAEIIGWAWCDTKQRAERTQSAPIFARRLATAIDVAADPHARIQYISSHKP